MSSSPLSSRTSMHDRPAAAHDGSLRLFWWAMGVAVLGLLVMYQSVDNSPTPVPGPAAAVAPAASGAGSTRPVAGSRKPGPVLSRSRPVRLHIPQLYVEAPFTDLSLNAAGTLEPPPVDNRNLVGWYKGGPSPGERGAAVVAGHVDTSKGPAVFLMLHLLTPGSTVDITREDGTVATFVVDSVKSFAKNAFPDREVYADTPNAQLRLITCGGAYDRKAKDYTDNLVVFAHLQSSRKS